MWCGLDLELFVGDFFQLSDRFHWFTFDVLFTLAFCAEMKKKHPKITTRDF